LRDPNHVVLKVEYTRALGIADEELRAYVPMPETIGSVYTLLYYARRSYEEALGALGYARERVAGMSGYAKTLYDGLATHYGVRGRACLHRRAEAAPRDAHRRGGHRCGRRGVRLPDRRRAAGRRRGDGGRDRPPLRARRRAGQQRPQLRSARAARGHPRRTVR